MSMYGRCKFCGCTERRPCLIPVVNLPYPTDEAPPQTPEILLRDYYVLPSGGIALVPSVESFLIPCSWLLDDVCNNPACVDQAYREACVLWERYFAEAA